MKKYQEALHVYKIQVLTPNTICSSNTPGPNPESEDWATRETLEAYLQDLAREDAAQVAFAEGGKLPQQNS